MTFLIIGFICKFNKYSTAFKINNDMLIIPTTINGFCVHTNPFISENNDKTNIITIIMLCKYVIKKSFIMLPFQ